MAGPGLLVNIDTTYPDSGGPSVVLHQRDHDKIHTTVNAIDVLGTSDGVTPVSTLPATPVMLAGVVANNQIGTSYTLVLADAGKVVELNNAATVALRIPTNASVPFPIGTCVELWQQGVGQVQVSVVSAPTVLRGPGGKIWVATQYGSVTLRKRATDEWCIEGDLV